MASSNSRNVTIAVMLLTGGPNGTVYGLYRGRLSYRKGVPCSIDLNKSDHFANVIVPQGEKTDYLQVAKDHEIPGYPAFNWGRP